MPRGSTRDDNAGIVQAWAKNEHLGFEIWYVQTSWFAWETAGMLGPESELGRMAPRPSESGPPNVALTPDSMDDVLCRHRGRVLT